MEELRPRRDIHTIREGKQRLTPIKGAEQKHFKCQNKCTCVLYLRRCSIERVSLKVRNYINKCIYDMDLYGIVYRRWSFWRDWPKNQRRLLMRPIQNGKSISIHFKDEELELLKEFEEYRKKNYFTRSGWVKQHMQRELHQQKQHCFRWNEKCKNLRRPLHDAFGLRKEMENE